MADCPTCGSIPADEYEGGKVVMSGAQLQKLRMEEYNTWHKRLEYEMQRNDMLRAQYAHKAFQWDTATKRIIKLENEIKRLNRLSELYAGEVIITPPDDEGPAEDSHIFD